MDDIKNQLRNLIASGKIRKAIDQLLALDISQAKKDRIVSISSRYKQLEDQKNQGVLTFEQVSVTENQILASLLEVINNLDKEASDDPAQDTPEGSFSMRKLTLMGIGVVVIMILLEAFGITTFLSKNAVTGNLQLTVFVTDESGNAVLENEGRLNIPLGNRSMNEIIGTNGKTNFPDITSDNKGDSITIGLEAEGWEIADGHNRFLFDGKPITLKVRKDNSLGVIKGVVKSRDGQEFLAGAEIRIGTDTIIYTDVNGNFNVTLPEGMQVASIDNSYTLTISAKGYKTTSQYYFPKTTTEIRLIKN